MAGYLSLVSGIGLLRVWGESFLFPDSIPEFLSSYQNSYLLFLASANRLSDFYWKVIFHTVLKRFSLHCMSAPSCPQRGDHRHEQPWLNVLCERWGFEPQSLHLDSKHSYPLELFFQSPLLFAALCAFVVLPQDLVKINLPHAQTFSVVFNYLQEDWSQINVN